MPRSPAIVLQMVVFLATACGAEPARRESPSADAVTETASRETASRETAPTVTAVTVTAPTDLGPCSLRLSAEAVRTAGGAASIRPRLTNQTATVMSLELVNPCPSGAAFFRGLPDGYDYYDTCTAGGCADNDPERIELAAGESRELPTVTLNPAGGECDQPIAPGTHALSFEVQSAGSPLPDTCGPGSIELVVE